MSSPTQRSLAECKKRGWPCQVVERWNQFAKRRIDLFSVIDIVAITPDGILGIQACAGASHAARRTKVIETPTTNAWLRAGGLMAVWSWSKRGGAKKRKLWALREERIVVPSSDSAVSDMQSDCHSNSVAGDLGCQCTYEVGSGGPTCTCGKVAA